MGYDTVRLVEHLPDQNPDALGVPDGVFVRPTVMVVFDAVKDEMTVVTPVRPQPGHRRGSRLCGRARTPARRRCRAR